MNWTEQRQGQEWNAEGQCAREACRGDITGVRYFNSSIRLHYCETCAVLINKHNPGLCTVDFQEPTLLAERVYTKEEGEYMCPLHELRGTTLSPCPICLGNAKRLKMLKVNVISWYELTELVDEDIRQNALRLFQKWVDRGDGVAVYLNQALDSADLGRRKFVSFGSEAAQLEGEEPPLSLPDIGGQIHWAYRLVAVHRGKTGNA